jgi:uncharacterized FAD-dependent dehydrogenase
MEQNDAGVFKGQIRTTPEEAASMDLLKDIFEDQMNLPEGSIAWVRILRKSIDARKRPVMLQLSVEGGTADAPDPSSSDPFSTQHISFPDLPAGAPEVLIVGSGPAGLYAALEFIRLGIKPIIVERGKNVRDRRRDLAAITKEHLVNPDSNYCYGEGGAGTYSDGKLYTRAKKRGHLREALLILVAHGAPEEILIDAHPHIGTNKLPDIITSMRETIEKAGGEVRFNTRLEDFASKDGKLTSATLVDVDSGESSTMPCTNLVLATGHSARDIFHLLNDKGLALEAKPFAIGVRIEHPQGYVDDCQYHGEPRLNNLDDERLPAASYSLVCQVDGRGVFSFCMCPGGIIAPCATSPGEIVTNGWSPSKRNNPYANSGMVVTIDEEVWRGAGFSGPLAALDYQASVERACWEAAGKTQKAPAQMLEDFMNGQPSTTLTECSYHPGVTAVNLHEVLPPMVSKALLKGFKEFAKKMNGFIHPDAIIVAPESRTSSPVKIPRDKESLQHPDVAGLYPCGEGGGYAGGILSAAMDGRKVAAAIHAEIAK